MLSFSKIPAHPQNKETYLTLKWKFSYWWMHLYTYFVQLKSLGVVVQDIINFWIKNDGEH